MAKNKVLMTGVLIVICVGVVFGVQWVKGQSNLSAVSLDARSKGPADADIKIVEFIDFQCPACAYGAQMLNSLFKQYPGKLFIQLKHFPLAMHPHAVTAALYVECAGQQGKFWSFHDKLVNQQEQWRGLTMAGPYFDNYARDLGLNIDQLRVCVNDDAVRVLIEEDKTEGRKLGLRSTPTYFVNDEMVVGPTSLKRKIKELLGQ